MGRIWSCYPYYLDGNTSSACEAVKGGAKIISPGSLTEHTLS